MNQKMLSLNEIQLSEPKYLTPDMNLGFWGYETKKLSLTDIQLSEPKYLTPDPNLAKWG